MKRSFVVLLHVAYWCMYLFLEFFVLMTTTGPAYKIPSGRIILQALFLSELATFMLLPAFIGFYTFYGVLFDRFLARKKMTALVLSALAAALAGAAITETVLRFSFPKPAGEGIIWSVETMIGIGLFLGFILIVHGVLGLVMKGFIRWYGDIRLKEELAHKNLEMELKLIRSQLNPHFLFNTLNNIDMLILKDPQKASDYLNELSGIMRFMLYETGVERIQLVTELEYIRKYIELQKIRSSNPDFISYTVIGQTSGIWIAPMLFIPFIENAFKHTENKKTDHAIRLHFEIGKDQVTFECSNRYSEKEPGRPDYGGLGNELISRRLQLLYPGRHTLRVTRADGLFNVKIVLSLT